MDIIFLKQTLVTVRISSYGQKAIEEDIWLINYFFTMIFLQENYCTDICRYDVALSQKYHWCYRLQIFQKSFVFRQAKYDFHRVFRNML